MKLDRRVSGSWFLLLFGLLAVPLAAQDRSHEGSQESSVLTEEAFVAAAMSHRALEDAASGERDLAAADLLRAALRPSPSLEVTREEPNGAARESSAVVRWTLPIEGRRLLRQKAAESGLGAADRRLEAARFQVRLKLREIYVDWATAWEQRSLLVAHLERVERLTRVANERARAGETSGLAARRFELEAAAVRAELGKTEAQLKLVESVIHGWLAPSAASDAAVDHRPRAPTLPPAPNDGTFASESDLASRPDLAALEREVVRAEVLLRLSERWLEAPEITLGWKTIEERGASSHSSSGPVIGLGWSLPLSFSPFDRRPADRSEANARLKTARAELELARARGNAHRTGALAAYERLRSEVQRAERVAESTGPLLHAAETAFQLGESGLSDLFDTLRAGLGARITALDLRALALSARRDLEAALGRSLEGENR